MSIVSERKTVVNKDSISKEFELNLSTINEFEQF